MERLFTLAEARDLLPRLQETGRQLREYKAQFDRHRTALHILSASIRAGDVHLRESLDFHRVTATQLTQEMQTLFAGLADLGVECKGIEQGLFDFRSERDGRIVFLCWQMEEADIGWWHDLDTGFAARRPLT